MALQTLTKSTSSRWWCFTWNLPDDVDWDESQAILAKIHTDERVLALVANPEEAPITGQRHWQSVLRLAQARKFGWVKKLLPDGCHIEKTKYANAAAELAFINLGKCE